MKTTESSPAAVSAVRRTTVVLGGGMLLLVAGLAALPFIASRPRPAPAVTFTTLAGEVAPLASLRGKPVLVSFWSTTCGPCVEEMPQLIALHRGYAPRGVRTFAVSMPYDRPDQVTRFAQTRGLPFEMVLDINGQLVREFNDTQATPTKFLIDAQGNIVRTFVGNTDFSLLRRELDSLLAG